MKILNLNFKIFEKSGNSEKKIFEESSLKSLYPEKKNLNWKKNQNEILRIALQKIAEKIAKILQTENSQISRFEFEIDELKIGKSDSEILCYANVELDKIFFLEHLFANKNGEIDETDFNFVNFLAAQFSQF